MKKTGDDTDWHHVVGMELDLIRSLLVNGCGNNGCRTKRPTGMAPNGPCCCTRLQISKRLANLAVEITKGT